MYFILFLICWILYFIVVETGKWLDGDHVVVVKCSMIVDDSMLCVRLGGGGSTHAAILLDVCLVCCGDGV